MKNKILLGVLAVQLSASAIGAPAPANDSPAPKHRVIILSDIENEPDDTQSFVRLFLYSNQIDIEAIVATTSTHMKNGVHPESIRKLIAGYGQVRANLLKHEAGFPAEPELQAKVFAGQPSYGMAAVGDGKDTDGSRRIIAILENADARPLWISIWGGANTLAQALHTLRATRHEADVKRLLAKLRVYTISDQDDAGAWLRRAFPDLFYIVSPGGYGNSTWGGIYEPIDGLDNETVSNAWLASHIQQGRGPYGALYPDVAYSMEGDTPSFLGLVPVGLSDPEHPEPMPRSFASARASIWRWRDAFQNDFAARVAWTTQPWAKANHPPVARLAHADRLTVKGGESFFLDAAGSTDPDGDSLSYLWINYPEAGSLKTPIAAQGAGNWRRVRFQAPQVMKPETSHFILALTDKGEPSLTRYRRIIVTIEPAS